MLFSFGFVYSLFFLQTTQPRQKKMFVCMVRGLVGAKGAFSLFFPRPRERRSICERFISRLSHLDVRRALSACGGVSQTRDTATGDRGGVSEAKSREQRRALPWVSNIEGCRRNVNAVTGNLFKVNPFIPMSRGKNTLGCIGFAPICLSY